MLYSFSIFLTTYFSYLIAILLNDDDEEEAAELNMVSKSKIGKSIVYKVRD